MEKMIAKWKALLLAVSCFAVCLGFGVAKIAPAQEVTTVTASAETTQYNLGELTVHSHSKSGENAKNSCVYLSATNCSTADAWKFFTLNDGAGITVNGVQNTAITMQDFSGGIYLGNFGLSVGDILSIEGTYVSADSTLTYVVPKSSFTWNGSGWLKCYTDAELAAYDTVTIHRLGLGTEYTVGGAVADKSTLSYKTSDDDNTSTGVKFRFGFKSTDTNAGEIAIRLRGSEWKGFHFQIIEGVVRDITGDWLSAALSSNTDHVIELGAIDTADSANVWIYIKLNGAIVTSKTVAKSSYSDETTMYSAFITKSISIYANANVTNATFTVAYETHNIGALSLHKNSLDASIAGTKNTCLYLKRADGNALPVQNWDKTFTPDSADNFKLNGENATLSEMKSTPAGLYLSFPGLSASDVITVSGGFTGVDYGMKYTIEESKFQWNGSAWVDYVEYATKDVTITGVHSTSQTGGVYVASDTLCLSITGGLSSVEGWPAFYYESGAGFKVNGVSAKLTTCSGNAIQDINGAIYFTFDSVSVGDVVSIGGVFTSTSLLTTYNITEASFIWMGSEWISYVEFTTHNLGEMSLSWASRQSDNAKSSQLYLVQESGNALPYIDDDWAYQFSIASGGLTVDGTSSDIIKIFSSANGLYFEFGGVSEGDVVAISGTFYNVTQKVRYVVEESTFQWKGKIWTLPFSEDELAYSDTVTLLDLGYGLEETFDATSAAIANTGLSYTASASNTTHSVKFRFGFNSNSTSGNLEIRLRGTDWQGIRFIVSNTKLQTCYTSRQTSVALKENTDYVIELGAIDTTDEDNIFIYAKLDGVLVLGDLIAKTATNPYEEGVTFSTFTTTGISLYFNEGSNYILTDPDRVSVTYTTENGSFTKYAVKNSTYTLEGAKSYKTLIGWVANGTLYPAGASYDVVESNLAFTALELDYYMDEGAAIRLASTADESGIRFTSYINQETLNTLKNTYKLTVTYGTLIMPYDYLATGDAPNLSGTYTVGEKVLQIPCTVEADSDRWEVTNGYVVYRGAMQTIKTGNYDRLFAGRGYMTLTDGNGNSWTVYTPFDKKDNVRSIRYVAQAFQADTTTATNGEIKYASLSDTRKEVVDNYAAIDSIELMDYAAYAANNFFNVIAWNYPTLDESKGYNNDTNKAIVNQLKATGVKVVNLTGANHIAMDTMGNIVKTRQIIEYFWSQGLKTVAFATNSGGLDSSTGGFANMNTDFTQDNMPDFSDCEGFIGFLFWDEPTDEDNVMTKLAELAVDFNTLYAGTDVTYMNNLLPSYASIFQTTTTSIWGSSSSLDKSLYTAYVAEYCEKVLSKVKGEKWLSVDTYPINADYSLHDTFLFDLGVIKYYAMKNGAHAHVALQSSGFYSDSDSTKKRMPTEAEMRMQAYAAMAFGFDSLSWFTYSPSGSASEIFVTMVDNTGAIIDQTAYNAFTSVNKELANISAVYSAFTWKGIILGQGSYSSNEDYTAFSTVKGQIGDYELSASKTKHISSIATNKTSLNYLMGVMQDASGNEGYVLCNYNALGSATGDKTQTITLTFGTNVTEVVIYRGGVATTETVSNRTLTIELATGEGVIVLPSKLG